MIGGRYKKGNNVSTEDALAKLGNMLKEKRLSMNVTQQVLSDHSGVSLTVIRRLESGTPISTNNLVVILRSLELLAELLSLYTEPELSLEDMWNLKEKQQQSKRKRASNKTN